jgi:hypothetical protein
MGTIKAGQACAAFKKVTDICGNCAHEKRERDDVKNRTTRSCSLHGWYVLMSSACKDHASKNADRRQY